MRYEITVNSPNDFKVVYESHDGNKKKHHVSSEKVMKLPEIFAHIAKCI